MAREWAAAALFVADLVPDDAREALNAGVEDSNGVVLGVSVVAGITTTGQPANRVVGPAAHGHSLTVHLARPPGEHYGPDGVEGAPVRGAIINAPSAYTVADIAASIGEAIAERAFDPDGRWVVTADHDTCLARDVHAAASVWAASLPVASSSAA